MEWHLEDFRDPGSFSLVALFVKFNSNQQNVITPSLRKGRISLGCLESLRVLVLGRASGHSTLVKLSLSLGCFCLCMGFNVKLHSPCDLLIQKEKHPS